MFPSHVRFIGQTLLILSLLELPVQASQTWVGAGRILEGVGQGGSVELRLEVNGDFVQSTRGPRLNGKLQDGMIQNEVGDWRFKRCAQSLCVHLQRSNPRQFILYRLRPVNP